MRTYQCLYKTYEWRFSWLGGHPAHVGGPIWACCWRNASMIATHIVWESVLGHGRRLFKTAKV
jgi:hypothetical protein